MKDLLTGEEFTPKRISQKFATPDNRIAYYNLKANELRHKNSFVNKPLHINVRILNDLLKNKSEEVFHKQFLAGKGFSFTIHTHFIEEGDKTLFAIYQYVIIPMGNDLIKIQKK